MLKLFIILILFINSCAGINKNPSTSQTKTTEPAKQERKIDTKKLAKEAGYMVAWDAILAAGCKIGLHLSIGVCLAADVIGDIGIITYHNFDVKEKIVVKKQESAPQQIAKKSEEQKKESSFHPIEFVLSVGLMAIMLVII